MKLIFLLFFFISIFWNIQAMVICENQNVEIFQSKLEYYKTSGYPHQPYAADDYCTLNFTINVLSKTGRFYILFLSSATQFQYDYDTNYVISDSQNYSLTTLGASYGYIYYDEWKDDDCPLESLSRENPLYIENIEEVVYLFSTLYKNRTRQHPCKWSFTAPEGFGFKIVIIQLNLDSKARVYATNSTGYAIFRDNPNNRQPYYNSDNHLIITLEGPAKPNADNYEFIAYISIVDNNPYYTPLNCTISTTTSQTDNSTLIKWYSDVKTALLNNAYCYYEFTIQPLTEVMVSTLFSFEEAADKIYFNDVYGLSQSVDKLKILRLKPYYNNTKRFVKFEFKSDGSVPGEFFRLEFQAISCLCATSSFVTYCNTPSIYYITSNAALDLRGLGYYCSNMQCAFNISMDTQCQKKYIYIEVWLNINTLDADPQVTGFSDNFTVISNNQRVLSLDWATGNKYSIGEFIQTAFIDSSADNIFGAITYNFEATKSISIKLTASDGPNILPTVTLSKNNPHYIVHHNVIPQNGIFTVKIDENLRQESNTIQIFGSDGLPSLGFFNYFALYNNNSMNYALDKTNCFSQFSDQCNIHNYQVATYAARATAFFTSELILYQIPKDLRNTGCVFESNVFELTQSKVISAVANEFGICTLFLMGGTENGNFKTMIESMWTNAKDQIKVYSGSENFKLLMKFNATTASKWKEIILFNNFYVIEIPVNSSVILKICNNDCPVKFKIPFLPLIPNISYSSIITTPFYGENLSYDFFYWFDNCFVNIEIDDRLVEFTVVDYNISSNFNFTFAVDNVIQEISTPGETIQVTNATVILCFTKLNTEVNAIESDVSGANIAFTVLDNKAGN